MTVSPDARTPSADLHTLTGSTQPGAAPTVQPFGVATAPASVAEMPDPFRSLGSATATHPDAAVIDLAARVKALAERERAMWDRVSGVEDAVGKAMPPRPVRPEMQNRMVSAETMMNGERTIAVTTPAGWDEEHGAREASYQAAVAEHERIEAEVGARLGLPLLEKLSDRASARLARWGCRLAEIAPQTQAGLKAKAAASVATAERGALLDPWRQQLATSVGADALRIIAAEADARAERDRQADGELLSLIAQYGPAMAEWDAADEAWTARRQAYDASKPKRPAALYWRATDRAHPQGREKHPDRDSYLLFYDERDVEKMRDKPATTIVEHRRPADWNPDVTIVRCERVPDEPREVRRLEILTASDAWVAEQATLMETTGLNAVNDLVEAASEVMNAIEDKILAYVPRTFFGLQAKAQWVASSPSPSARAKYLLRDILQMPPVATPLQILTGLDAEPSSASPDRRAVAAYREWLDMETKLLAMEMYPEGGDQADRFVPMNTAAKNYHFPIGSGMAWRDLPQPTSRAEAMCQVLGIDWTVDGERDDHFLPVAPVAADRAAC